MAGPAAGKVRAYRSWLALALGWLALAGAYHVALPVFGVSSTVTWLLLWCCWIGVIGMPLLAAGASVPRRAARPVALWCLPVAFAGAALWTLGPPQLTSEGQFRQHRGDLERLAADYRAGRIGGNVTLPWRLRFLSVDGQAHPRCGVIDRRTGHRDCALFLLQWQDWRGENGGGIAYNPQPFGPDPSIVTAAGDSGNPVRALGAGWWVIA